MPSRKDSSPGSRRIPSGVFDHLVDFGDGTFDLDQRLEHAARVREHLGDDAAQMDRFLISHIMHQNENLGQARDLQTEIQSLLDAMADAPWHPAVFRRRVETRQGERALVSLGGSRRVVAAAEDVDIARLEMGEEVFLEKESRMIVARSFTALLEATDICTVEERLSPVRARVKWRDEQVLIDLAQGLHETSIESGDRLRYDRSLGMAFEKLDCQASREHFATQVADISRDQVGGQDANLDALLGALTVSLTDPEAAAAYGLSGRLSILLIGPPGTGKTLLARCAAAELQRHSGPVFFVVVKPGEWESPWVGETQAKIRETFQALRESAREGLVVLFLDEIEAIGRIRGGREHGDKFLAALLAELDGFEARDRIAVIAATNRKELCDPALLERVSDIELVVDRPRDRASARSILEIHLPESCPFAAGSRTRDDILDAVASQLYSPNGNTALSVLTFRDGTQRTIRAPEMLSGRNLEQICREARRQALQRQVAGGPAGLSMEDALSAVASLLDRLATTLAPVNAAAHLSDLPQDADVVSAVPQRGRTRRAHDYLTAA